MTRTTKARIRDNAQRILEAIPSSLTAGEVLRKAGYSEVTAQKAPGKTIERAIKHMEKRAQIGDKHAQSLLSKINVSEGEFAERIKHIALKSNQHAVSLQLLAPALKERGYDISGAPQPQNTQIIIGVIPHRGTTADYEVVEPQQIHGTDNPA